MKKTAIAYIAGVAAFCERRKFSEEGRHGYLENVLFQLKRKEQKNKERLATIGEEILGIKELLKETEDKTEAEE